MGIIEVKLLEILLHFITIVVIYYHSEHSALLSSIGSTCIHVRFQVLGRNETFAPAAGEGYPFFGTHKITICLSKGT